MSHKNGTFYGYYLDDGIQEYFKLLFDNNIVIKYHYQNQSNMPDSITKTDWAQRELIWDDLIYNGHTWAENGFELSIVTDIICYDLHLIIKSIQKKLILAAYRHM